MPDCPLAKDCPSFEERINGMGCHHYGDRGGAEWCNHYNQPIRELNTAPVQPGEEVIVEIDDIHESGSGVGRTEEGFIVLVDGILPDARAKVKITNVKGNHALADPVERLPMEPDEADEAEDGNVGTPNEGAETKDDRRENRRQRLGSRDNFWGG
jgi:predicted RNA-binding protein with TRAM domain